MTDADAPFSILVVDDTPENLRVLTPILAHLGYEVRPVTDGQLALEAAERHPPDLVLLDINMPRMNGYEVCRRLKTTPGLTDVPVIFLTALGDVADKLRAFEVGGVDYITKPFQVEEVQARVKTQLALRRANVTLQRSYEQLKQLEKLRDDLVHMIVHDMRSPLSVVLTHLELLQGELGQLNPDIVEDLDGAMRGARALTRMANDLLDVSRLEEGKLPLKRELHDLVALASASRASLAKLDGGRSIELETQGKVQISCDGALIQRVILNLLGNAIKHTRATARIALRVLLLETAVRVEVVDDGPGVPLDARQRIFEKFGTVSSSNESRYHSAGLGLAFCKLAVEAHGGSIGVREQLPHGSVFWFEIPCSR